MVQAIAINTVTICTKPGERSSDGRTVTPAVLEDKLPGTIFECGEEDFAAFESAGAVRAPSKAELAAVEPAKPAKVETKA